MSSSSLPFYVLGIKQRGVYGREASLKRKSKHPRAARKPTVLLATVASGSAVGPRRHWAFRLREVVMPPDTRKDCGSECLRSSNCRSSSPGTGLRVLPLLSSWIHQEFVVLVTLIFSAVKKTDAYSRLLDGCKKTDPNAFFNAEVSLWFELGCANSSCLCWKGFPGLGVRVQGHESKHTCRLKTIKMTMQEMPSLHLVTSKLSFHMLQSKNLKMLACREVPVWCYGQEGTPLESAAS